MELLGHRACISPTLFNNTQLFFKCTNLHSQQLWLRSLSAPLSCQNFLDTRSLLGVFGHVEGFFFPRVFLSLFSYYLASRWSSRILPPGSIPWLLKYGSCPSHNSIASYVVPFMVCLTLYCNDLLYTCLSSTHSPPHAPDWGIFVGRGCVLI